MSFRQLLVGCSIIREISAVVVVIVRVNPKEYLRFMQVKGPINYFDRLGEVIMCTISRYDCQYAAIGFYQLLKIPSEILLKFIKQLD